MIPLHPLPDPAFECPVCARAPLEARGWHMPGMRCLADLRCAECGREFYADLPAGQALYTPMLLEKATGVVHDAHGVPWFADWLRDSYAARTDAPVPFDVHEFAPLTRKAEVVVVNCLDTLYGHALLKLLNVQHYLDRREADVIVCVPSMLAWMVPSGAAEVWSINLPLRRGTEWNEWLAREIRRRIEKLPRVNLSVAFSHPHPEDYDIERFTRITPFPLNEWASRAAARPTVTFIWRADRLWDAAANDLPSRMERLKRRLNPVAHNVARVAAQLRKVVEMAESLRREWPTLDFAVAGLGEAGGLPEWISDLRRTEPDDGTERLWCERYAASHTVVGVHGSNMLLPSAHAGSVVELIGAERAGNFLQDILFRGTDAREMFFRYRFAPHAMTPAELARLLSLLLRGYPEFQRLMGRDHTRHATTDST